jgi:RimJ/RimL family protein N-acetyltransferase
MVCGINLKIERTRDMGLVKQLASDPAIYPEIIDDSFSDKKNCVWQPENAKNKYYLIPYLCEKEAPPCPLGVIAYYPINHILFEGHLFILPAFQHIMTAELGHMANKWMFQHSSCQSIIAFVPTSKPHVLKFVKKAGLKQVGILPASYASNGEIVDQYIFRLGKQDYGTG